jgi:isoleucyl-tRNA synthetase
VDLGGFYLDVIKDRLYTTAPRGLPRRSAQTAMYHVLEAMVRWLAPVLSFTAEEIWRHLPGERPESVFLSTWADLPGGETAATAVDWTAVLEVRAAVLRELELLRVAGGIGAPLDAVVDVYAAPGIRAALAPLGDELRFVLITSEAHVHPAEARPPDAVAGAQAGGATGGMTAGATGEAEFWIRVRPSTAVKCVRCWHKRDDVGSVPTHPELCGRCVVNLDGAGETRRFA